MMAIKVAETCCSEYKESTVFLWVLLVWIHKEIKNVTENNACKNAYINFKHKRPYIIILIWILTKIKNKEWDTGEVWETVTKTADAVTESGGDWGEHEWMKKDRQLWGKKKKTSDFYCTYSCKAIREIKTMKNSMQVGHIFVRSFVRWFKKRRKVTPPYNKNPSAASHIPFQFYLSP